MRVFKSIRRMTRNIFFLTVIAGFTISMASLGFAGPDVGEPAPNFTLPDTASVNHSLSDFTGKVIVIDFWASTCGACRAELPKLDAMQKEYDTAQVRIITINLGESWSTVKSYARNNSCLFLRDGTYTTWNAYKQGGYIPLNYVLCANHIVKDWMEGYSDSQVRDWINQCLPGIEEKEKVRDKKQEARIECFPNPFRQRTVIRYSLNGNCDDHTINDLRLTIHDIAGRLIRTFTINDSSTGSDSRFTIHEVTWNGKDSRGVEVLSGVYFCKLTTEKVNLIEKLIVVK